MSTCNKTIFKEYIISFFIYSCQYGLFTMLTIMNLILSPILPSHRWASSPEKSMSVPSLVLPTVKHSVECNKRSTFQYPIDGCVGKMNHVNIPNIGINHLSCLLRQTHFTCLSHYKILYEKYMCFYPNCQEIIPPQR